MMKQIDYLYKFFLHFFLLTFFINASAQDTSPTGDWDSDGIQNQTDLDDDNDGILDTSERVGEAVANSISNSTFTGNANGWQLNGGWQYSSNQLRNVTDSQTGSNADDLNYINAVLDTDCAESAEFTLRIRPTNYINTAGEGFDSDARLRVYVGGVQLFDVYNRSTNSPALVTKQAGSTIITSMKVNGTTVNTTTTVSVGSYSSYVITLNSNNLPRNGNITIRYTANLDDFYVDDVYYNVIKCVDTDNDGIPNHLDSDSDGDGCPDAVEGDENVKNLQLNANGSINTATNGGIDVNGVPNLVNSGGTADTDTPTPGDLGQGLGNSANPAINDCHCYKNPAVSGGSVLDTNTGISSLGRNNDDTSGWPQVRKGAWIALESKTKGFVVNRVPTSVQLTAIPNPVEGMMVYDEEADCLKIYSSKDNGATFNWFCFSAQGCPDN